MAGMNLNVKRGFKTGTRISKIQVPPELRVKHTTGLTWIDDILGGEGGFTASSVVMLTGGPGCGKSTLLRQLTNAMLAAKRPEGARKVIPIYNTGEESLFQAKMACERLKLEQDFQVGEETDLPKLLTYMDNVRKENKDAVITLMQDSLQTLNDMKYKDGGTTGNTPVRCAEMLVDWAQQNFGHIWFVGQVTKGGEFAGKNVIKHAIDVHMHLFYDEDKKSATYGMLLGEVQKNRWGCNGKTYILGLTSTGIEERGSFTKAKDFRVGDDDEEAEAAQ